MTFANNQNHDSRTRLQQALDKDAAPASQEFVLENCGLDFEPQAGPQAPIFRRAGTSPKRSFSAGLFASLKRA